jgi:hypothetical protein
MVRRAAFSEARLRCHGGRKHENVSDGRTAEGTGNLLTDERRGIIDVPPSISAFSARRTLP